VPGGGLSLDGTRWIACRRGFFLPVRVLSRLFRRLFLRDLQKAFDTGHLRFFGKLSDLSDPEVFARRLDALRHTNWVVYAKPPFGGAILTVQWLEAGDTYTNGSSPPPPPDLRIVKTRFESLGAIMQAVVITNADYGPVEIQNVIVNDKVCPGARPPEERAKQKAELQTRGACLTEKGKYWKRWEQDNRPPDHACDHWQAMLGMYTSKEDCEARGMRRNFAVPPGLSDQGRQRWQTWILHNYTRSLSEGVIEDLPEELTKDCPKITATVPLLSAFPVTLQVGGKLTFIPFSNCGDPNSGDAAFARLFAPVLIEVIRVEVVTNRGSVKESW
jgi:hypothetical protein